VREVQSERKFDPVALTHNHPEQMTTTRTSRRDFIAASALGLIGIAARAATPAEDSELLDDELLYVGTYTEGGRTDGIYLVRLDTQSGALRQVGSLNAGANPSFLAVHPNGRVLYAVNEVTQRDGLPMGAVSAFAIASDSGVLTRLNEQRSEGGAPCYVSVDRTGRALLVANYVGGNIALFPIEAGGGVAVASHVVQHQGTGPNTARQEAAHAHCILPDPSNRFALAADLGVDRVLVYRLDVARASLRHVAGGDGIMRPGAGPRHLAFHPRLPLVFVANELNSTVTTLRFDSENGRLSPIDTRSTLPGGWTGTSYVADIHVALSGRTVYVSNRGHNSIAVFSAGDTGALALEQVISTEGDWPRNFSLDPTGRWLLVANQRSSDIVVFARDDVNGRLTATGKRITVPSPVCLRFLRDTS
jgi:6-phosphogluconolactonase